MEYDAQEDPEVSKKADLSEDSDDSEENFVLCSPRCVDWESAEGEFIIPKVILFR